MRIQLTEAVSDVTPALLSDWFSFNRLNEFEDQEAWQQHRPGEMCSETAGNSPSAPWQISVLVAPPMMNSGLETSSWKTNQRQRVNDGGQGHAHSEHRAAGVCVQSQIAPQTESAPNTRTHARTHTIT